MSLLWLRCDKHMAAAELQDISKRLQDEKEHNWDKDTCWDLLSNRAMLKPLVIINVFAVCFVLSGAYLIVYYVVDIVREIEMDIDAMNAAVYSGAIRLVSTVGCLILVYTINRRTLLLGSSVIASVSCLTLVAFVYARSSVPVKTPLDTYLPAACLLLFTATTTAFIVLSGVVMSELLPTRIRGNVGGLTVCLFHGGLFLMAKIFPYFIQAAKTQGVFLLFGLTCTVSTIFVFAVLPETNGRTLGQIEDYFKGSNWLWMNRSDESKKAMEV